MLNQILLTTVCCGLIFILFECYLLWKIPGGPRHLGIRCEDVLLHILAERTDVGALSFWNGSGEQTTWPFKNLKHVDDRYVFITISRRAA